MCVALESLRRCGLNYRYMVRRGITSQFIVTLKANSHIACCAHAVPLPRHAAPLPCSDSAVSFVNVRVVTGNIRTASPAV